MSTSRTTIRSAARENQAPLVHACPECGRVDAVTRILSMDFYDMSVQCRCQVCDISWQVYVDPAPSIGEGLIAS